MPLLLLFMVLRLLPVSLLSRQRKVRRVSRFINVGANLSVSRKSDYRDYFDAAGYLKFHQDWRKMYYTYGQGEDGLYDYYQAKDGSGNLLYPAGYYDDPKP